MQEKNSGKITILVAIITLLGSIITALIANWDKVFSNNNVVTSTKPKIEATDSKEIINRLASANEINSITPKALLYVGNVGKLKAQYSLKWNNDSTIEGTYFYPNRHSMTYTLKGRDLGNGEILLIEYTGNTISAKCKLFLSSNCYSGIMDNTDGRSFDMTLCKE